MDSLFTSSVNYNHKDFIHASHDFTVRGYDWDWDSDDDDRRSVSNREPGPPRSPSSCPLPARRSVTTIRLRKVEERGVMSMGTGTL